MVQPRSQCNWDKATCQLVGPVNYSPSPPVHDTCLTRDRHFGTGIGCTGQSQSLAARSTGYAYISVALTRMHRKMGAEDGARRWTRGDKKYGAMWEKIQSQRCFGNNPTSHHCKDFTAPKLMDLQQNALENCICFRHLNIN